MTSAKEICKPGLREPLSSERMSLQVRCRFAEKYLAMSCALVATQEKIEYDLPYQPCDRHANSTIKLHSNQCIVHTVC